MSTLAAIRTTPTLDVVHPPLAIELGVLLPTELSEDFLSEGIEGSGIAFRSVAIGFPNGVSESDEVFLGHVGISIGSYYKLSTIEGKPFEPIQEAKSE